MHCHLPASACSAIPSRPGRLHDVLGDGKARLIERGEHVGKYLPDGGHAAHVVEGILEVRVGRVMRIQRGQMRGRQLLVQRNQPLRGGLGVWIDIRMDG